MSNNSLDFPILVNLAFFKEAWTLPGIGTVNKVEHATHPKIVMKRVCTGLVLEYDDEIAEVPNENIKVMRYAKVPKAG